MWKPPHRPHRLAGPGAAALLTLGCDPVLEKPPLAPDAGPATDGSGALEGGTSAGSDAGEGPGPEADGSQTEESDGGGPCTPGDTLDCACAGIRDDGSPIRGLSVCSDGAFAACRCADLDAGTPESTVPSCGGEAYAGTLRGTLHFEGLSPAVEPRSMVAAIAFTLQPVGSDGRREAVGALRATVGGLADLDGELRGHLACGTDPPAFTALATAEFGWLGTTYSLQGEITGDLTGGSFPSGAWLLTTDSTTMAIADGEGSWSASPQ